MKNALKAYAEKGIDVKAYICDVTDEKQVQEMVLDIEQNLGVIDILVDGKLIN